MWIHAGWLGILQFCFFFLQPWQCPTQVAWVMATTATHQHSLDPLWVAAVVCAVPLDRPRVLGKGLPRPPQSRELTCTERRWQITVSPVPPQPHFRQPPHHHSAFWDISFSTRLIAAHSNVPDLSFRNCDWQEPSLAPGLHCLSAKSRYSVHATEARTHTQKNGNPYLSSANCHSSALWVSPSKWIIPACFSGVSWSFLSVLCSERLVCKYFIFNQQVWILLKKLL